MTDERYERYIKRIKRDAMERDKFTEEQMESKYLDGFDKMTTSPRIMRLVTLAYYRGMMRGVDMVKQGEQIVTLS
jgi:hypothetical protein